MPQTQGTTFLRKLRRIVVAQSPSQLADDELLRQFIRERDGFSVGVAGFPEGHIACKEGKLADWPETSIRLHKKEKLFRSVSPS